MSKILVMLLAISCLNACTSDEVKPFEDYQYDVEIKKVETNDNQELYTVNCYRRKYHMWLDYIGAVDKWQPVQVSECKLLIGYQPKAYSDEWALKEYARKEISAGIEEKERIFGSPDK